MKSLVVTFILVCIFIHLQTISFGQNVGVNCLTPAGKLHVKGSDDVSQLIIEANSTQSNINPLIRLRKSTGLDLKWIHTDDTTNIFMGLKSGRVNNVAGGGINNTLIGKNSGYTNTTGSDNTAVGMRALYLNSTGTSNSAFGSNALYHNTNGNGNTAIGRDALNANTTGDENTAVGQDALTTNSEGSFNTAIGYYALKYNTGSGNTALGVTSLFSNNAGSNNTVVGQQAMFFNEGGSNATAIGKFAMFNANDNSNSFIHYNVAVGYEALYGGFPASGNTGNYNTALGYQSMYSNTTGSNNAANGYLALSENTSGINNAADGSHALDENTTGSQNSGFGYNAVGNNTTGSGNTGLGDGAYFITSTLNNTTAVGYLSGGQSNVSNRIEIGNTSVNWIGGEVAWSTYSDSRIKDHVEANVPGLDFINRLRPVTYNLNIHRQNEMAYSGKKEVSDWPEKYDIEKMRITGFIAQEVAQAAEETGYEFSGVEIPKNPNELYSIRYSDFVMPLVKAVQELNGDKDELKSEVENLKSENQNLIKRIEKLEELMINAAH